MISIGWIYCGAGILFCAMGVYTFFKTIYEKEKRTLPSFLLMIMGVILIGIGTAKYLQLAS
jgi:tellurite resistance protein TehA-like permease